MNRSDIMDSTINTISTTLNTPSKREYSINGAVGQSLDSDNLITGRSELDKDKDRDRDRGRDIQKGSDESSDSEFSDDEEITYLRKKASILNGVHKMVNKFFFSKLHSS